MSWLTDLQSRVTPWHQYASHVKVHGTSLKMDVVLSQKPIIWYPELLLKFIRGFNAVLGLSKLIVNLRSSGEALAFELKDRNWWQSE